MPQPSDSEPLGKKEAGGGRGKEGDGGGGRGKEGEGGGRRKMRKRQKWDNDSNRLESEKE